MLVEEGLFGQLLAEKSFLASGWPKSPSSANGRPKSTSSAGRRGDTFDFSALGCIVSEFAIKIIIGSKKIL